jgi:hypothetical protein
MCWTESPEAASTEAPTRAAACMWFLRAHSVSGIGVGHLFSQKHSPPPRIR